MEDIREISENLTKISKAREVNQKKRSELDGQKKQILQQLQTTFGVTSEEDIMRVLKEKRKDRDTKGEEIQRLYDELKPYLGAL